MSDFEWKTDEDSDWDGGFNEPTPPPSRRRWPWLLLLTIVLGVGGVSLWRAVERQVILATEDTEADVLAGFNLINQAANTGDIEIFSAILSGADRSWTAAQQQLVAQGALFDREAFGLTLLPTAPEVVATTLSPDLASAEIDAHYQYAVELGSGYTKTVTLSHTLIFRRGVDRWLYAPPDADFWSVEPTTLSPNRPIRVWLESPRDSDIANRLDDDLNAIYHHICQQNPRLRCLEDGLSNYVVARLYADPAQLSNLNPSLNLPRAGSRALPTPTLVGLPVDDAGYQALLRGYARLVIAPLVAEAAGYACCDHQAVAQALIDWAMAELGLSIWHLDQAAVDSAESMLAQLDTVWTATATAAPPALHHFIDFLVTELPGLTPYEALQALGDDEQTLAMWIAALTDGRETPISWTLETGSGPRLSGATLWLWDAHLRHQAQAPKSVTARAAAADETQAVALSCQVILDNGTLRSLFYQYDVQADRWHEIGRDLALFSSVTGFYPLPQGNGVWVREQPRTDPVNYIHFFVNGAPTETFRYLDQQQDPIALWGRTDPTGTKVVASQFLADRFGWFDLTTCFSGSCSFDPLPGEPLWSPSGAHVLFWDRARSADGSVYLAGAADANARPIGNADAAPVWLGDGAFGYVDNAKLLDSAHFVQHNADGAIISRLPLAPIADQLLVTNGGRVRDVVPLVDPAAPERLYFLVYYNDVDAFNVISYVSLVVHDGAGFQSIYATADTLSDFHFSADGRFLNFAERNNNTSIFAALTYDGETGALDGQPVTAGIQAMPSQSGHWTAILEQNALLLHENTGSQTRRVTLPGATCHHLQWIN